MFWSWQSILDAGKTLDKNNLHSYDVNGRNTTSLELILIEIKGIFEKLSEIGWFAKFGFLPKTLCSLEIAINVIASWKSLDSGSWSFILENIMFIHTWSEASKNMMHKHNFTIDHVMLEQTLWIARAEYYVYSSINGCKARLMFRKALLEQTL